MSHLEINPRSTHEPHKFPQMAEGPNSPLSVDFADIYSATEGKVANPKVAWAIRVAHSHKHGGSLGQEFLIHRTQVQDAIGQALQLLGISNPDLIMATLRDKHGEPKRKADTHRRLASLYGIEKPGAREKESTRLEWIDQLGKTANGFIQDLRDTVLAPVAHHIPVANEVVSNHDPIDLLAIIFNADNQYSPKTRFEAKRKLFLMGLAASVEYRAGEMSLVDKWKEFTEFLGKHVWDRNRPVGETVETTLLSEHSFRDYNCESVQEIPPKKVEAEIKKVKNHMPDKDSGHLRITTLSQRYFNHHGRLIPAAIEPRLKPEESIMRKLLVEGSEDPAVKVEDAVGMMVVLKDLDDVRSFMDHLRDAAQEAGTHIKFEKIVDTLTVNQPYETDNPGSAPELRMLRFIARVQGMLIEVMVHTYDSYLDYAYSDITGHGKHDIERLTDPKSRVIELLFPQVIYKKMNPDYVKKELMEVEYYKKRTNRVAGLLS